MRLGRRAATTASLALGAGVLGLAASLGGCGSSGGGGAGGTGGSGGSGGAGGPGTKMIALAASDDTFINDGNPDNNNGASASLFTGVDGRGGVTRTLIRFEIPAALQGVTVTSVELKLTLQALGNGSAGTGHIQSLQAITESWVQGNGVGDAAMSFTVGQPCSATVTGATWNQPACAAGTTTTWATAGGSVTGTVSGQVDTTGLAVEAPVIWNSAATANGGLVTDVQHWIDDPTSNHGWRISSSDETTSGSAQRFHSTEGGGTTLPALTIVYQPRS